MKFNQSWSDQKEEVSLEWCMLGAASIICLVLVGLVFVYVGLSL